jgi:carbon monoxide dehydrogenase subunit G
MRFEEQLRVPVSVPEAWDFLWQTERLAACLPGCRRVEVLEPGKTYRGLFEDAIGPYKVSFTLDIRVVAVQPQERVRVEASGQDRRLGITQQVALDVALRPADAETTVLDVTADVQVLGKIATLGQFVIQRKAKDIVQQFTRNIAAALEPRAAR